MGEPLSELAGVLLFEQDTDMCLAFPIQMLVNRATSCRILEGAGGVNASAILCTVVPSHRSVCTPAGVSAMTATAPHAAVATAPAVHRRVPPSSQAVPTRTHRRPVC